MSLDSLPRSARDGVARCEAQTAWRYTDFGQEPLRCHRRIGLRYVEAADGSLRPYCSSPGHKERVIAQARRA